MVASHLMLTAVWFFQGAVVTSDALITVSQGYASEITSLPQEHGTHLLLAERAQQLSGIVNGIDEQEWDPATDPHLQANYSPRVRVGSF
jgi:starch synthase